MITRIFGALASVVAMALGSAVSAQDSYPWMSARAGDWAILDADGNEICIITFKPVGEFSLTEDRSGVDASRCPEPYSELTGWTMPDEEFLALTRGWRTPFQGQDRDRDGVFEGYFGRRRDGVVIQLVQRTGGAAGRSTVDVVDGPLTEIDLLPPILHYSELVAGTWDIYDGDDNRLCQVFLNEVADGLSADFDDERYRIDEANCPEPFDRVDFWSSAKPGWLEFHNNVLVGPFFEGRDPDGDGVYDAEIQGNYFYVVPERIERIQRFRDLEEDAGLKSQWSRLYPPGTELQGRYLFREVSTQVHKECEVRLFLDGNASNSGSFVAGPNCPERLRQTVRWSVRNTEGVVFEARDGSALIGQTLRPFPMTLNLRRYEGPAIDKNGTTDWQLTAILGPRAVDVEGYRRLLPDLTGSDVVGVWFLNSPEERNCRVELRRDGEVRSSCAAFWSRWRIVDGDLVIFSSTQTVMFRGVVREMDLVVNIEDPRERLTR